MIFVSKWIKLQGNLKKLKHKTEHVPVKGYLCVTNPVWFIYKAAYLHQVEVGIPHRVAEVTLDVGHSLTFDLNSIPDPHGGVNLS